MERFGQLIHPTAMASSGIRNEVRVGVEIHELIARCRESVELYEDRLSETSLMVIRMHLAGGEWGEVVSNLVADLANSHTAVTRAERDGLEELVVAVGEGEEFLVELVVAE